MLLLSQNHISIDQILAKYPNQKLNIDRLDLAKLETLDFFEITYLSNSKKIKGFVALPKNTKIKLPIIIYNRGGSKEFAKIDSEQLTGYIASLALGGFIVVASQYSGNGGSEGKDERGGVELEDVLVLREVASEVEHADTENVFMVGVSRGGMMAYLANTRVGWIKKTAILCGEVDIQDSIDRRPEYAEYISDMYDTKSEDENRKRSIIYNINQLKQNANFMIFQGSLDKQLHPQRVLDFTNLLYASKIPFSFHFLDGQDHYFGTSRIFVINRIIRWFGE